MVLVGLLIAVPRLAPFIALLRSGTPDAAAISTPASHLALLGLGFVLFLIGSLLLLKQLLSGR